MYSKNPTAPLVNFFKSVKIWQNYISVAPFFGPPCSSVHVLWISMVSVHPSFCLSHSSSNAAAAAMRDCWGNAANVRFGPWVRKPIHLLQIVSSVLVRVERRKLLLTSGYQFVFYLLMLVAGIVPFHSYIYRATTQVGFFIARRCWKVRHLFRQAISVHIRSTFFVFVAFVNFVKTYHQIILTMVTTRLY